MLSAWERCPLYIELSERTLSHPRVINSPAASPGILHHTVWRTWLCIAYSDERCLYYQSLTTSLSIHFSFKGRENVPFELRSAWKGYTLWRTLQLEIKPTAPLNPFPPKSDQCKISPAASAEVLHHTVKKNLAFHERWLYYQFSLPHL